LQKANKEQNTLLSSWLKEPEAYEFFQTEKGIFKAIPITNLEALSTIDKALYRKSFGITMGQIKGKNLVPDHELALSTILHPDIPTVALSKEEALIFLKKEVPQKDWQGKGWHLATYQNLPLGWLKLVPGRANNYLPTHWRIRMEVSR
jgi:NOL1/NOP2/fmu family ribosome biogenesis protein